MYLNYTSVRNVMELVSTRLAETEGIPENLVPSDFNKLVIATPPHVFDRLLKFVKEHRMEIINESSNRYVSSIVTHLILEMGPEMRKAMRDPPQEILEFLRDYLAYYDGKKQVEPVLSRDVALKYIRYLMIPIDKKNRFLVLPSEDELSEIEEKGATRLEELASKTIASIYLDSPLVEYDPHTRSVSVSGKPIYRVENEVEFANRARHTQVGDLVRGAIMDRVFSKVSTLLKGLDFKKPGFYATAKCDEIGRILGVDVPEEMRGKEITVEFNAWLSDKEVYVTFKAGSSVVDSQHSVVSRIPLSELDRLGEYVRNAFSHAVKVIPEREKLLSIMRDRLESRNYTLYDYGTDNLFGYETSSYEAKLIIYSRVDVTDNTIAHMNIQVKYKKEVDPDTVKRVLRERGYPVDEMNIYADEKSVEIVYEKGVTSIEEGIKLVEQFINLKEVLEIARRAYLKEKRVGKEEKPSKKSISPEEAFALYLVFLFDPPSFRGNFSSVQEQVRKLLESTNSQRVKEAFRKGRENKYSPLIVHYEEILSELFLGGHIRVLEEDVIIFGKSMSELLRGLGYSEDTVKNLVRKAVEGVSLSLVNLRPSDLAKQIDGKTLWDTLPKQSKKVYAENMTPEKVNEILADPKLVTVFSDIMDEVVRGTLERGGPVAKTLIIYHLRPEILGTKRRLEITNEPGVPAINAGMFYVHVYCVGGGHVDYIVYRKDTKIGLVFRGRTLSEAIMKALNTYDKAVEKAKWSATQERKLGNLVLPLDANGNPIRGDDVVKESTRYEEISH